MRKQFVLRKFMLFFVLLLIPGCLPKKIKRGFFVKKDALISDENLGSDNYRDLDKKSGFSESPESFEVCEEDDIFFASVESKDSDSKKTSEDSIFDDDLNLDEVERYFEKGSLTKGSSRTIYFDFDSYEVLPNQESALLYNLGQIRKMGKRKTIILEGHSCKFGGSRVYNIHLSVKRAESVKRYLREKGIKNPMKVVGRGYENCIIPYGDKMQQSINRRVEFLYK